MPDVIVDSVRLGRITALQKPNGGVRGIIAGDMMRRLVARQSCGACHFSFPVRHHHSVLWRVYCARTPGHTDLAPQFFQSMALEHSTSLHEVRFLDSLRSAVVVIRPSPSSCNSTATLPPICGKMIQVKLTRSCKAKKERRAML